MKPSSLRLLLVLALSIAALLAACAVQNPARFPHLTHLVGLRCGKPGTPACLDCNSCHASSKDGARLASADPALCVSCHQANPRVVARVIERPAPVRAHIAFNHDQHLAMKELQGQCVSCHAGVVKQGVAPLPPMSECFTCHEHQAQWDSGQCAPCHSAKDLARTLPQSFLRHDQGFARHHGQVAIEDRQLCQSCHTQTDCAGCHDVTQGLSIEQRRPEKLESTLIHGGGFLVRHAIEAQAEPTRCARCHTPQTCDSCHLERGVSGNLPGGRNPHPPGWVGTVATGSSHGREARRDILLCAGCHDQGPNTNCIRCHKVGGFGGNPHPSGWQSTRSPTDSMCRYCHE